MMPKVCCIGSICLDTFYYELSPEGSRARNYDLIKCAICHSLFRKYIYKNKYYGSNNDVYTHYVIRED